jgi:DNA transformation protein
MYDNSNLKHMTACFVSQEYLMLDVFSDIPGITCKSMFGGVSFYKDGIIFACIADGILYFKVDDINRPQYEAMESQPFVYEHVNTKKVTTMPYYELPESIMEDKDKLKLWIDTSVSASLRNQKKGKKKL